MNDNNNFFFLLSYLANICQLASFDMNISEVQNGDIMQHLSEQDKILTEQTNVYLKRIVEQNEEILELLKKIGSSK